MPISAEPGDRDASARMHDHQDDAWWRPGVLLCVKEHRLTHAGLLLHTKLLLGMEGCEARLHPAESQL